MLKLSNREKIVVQVWLVLTSFALGFTISQSLQKDLRSQYNACITSWGEEHRHSCQGC